MNKSLLKRLVRQHYIGPEEEISSFERANGYSINSQNFVISLSSERQLFIKILSQYDNTILRKLEILNECSKEGIRVAEIIKGKRDELYITEEDFLLVAFKYYSGEKCHFTSKEIFSAGENLARLNQKLSQIKDVFNRSYLYSDLNIRELEQIKQSSRRDDNFGKKVLSLCKKLPRLYDFVNNVFEHKEDSQQLVHLDYHSQNVLFMDQEVEAILDFDFIITAPKLQSIGFACNRFCQDAQEMVIFLKAYKMVDRTLSLGLLGLIPIYVQREALCRMNYILRSHFFYSDKKWDFELDRHLENLDKMDKIKDKFIRKTRESLQKL